MEDPDLTAIDELTRSEASLLDTPPTGATFPQVPPRSTTRISRCEIAAWLILAVGILFFLLNHLVAGLVAGLLFYRIMTVISGTLGNRLPSRFARPTALIIATLLASAILFGGIMVLVGMVKSQTANVPALMTKMAEILESTRVWLRGIGGEEMFPEAVRDAEDFKNLMVAWLHENATVIKVAGGNLTLAIVHIVMGLLAAVLVFFRHREPAAEDPEDRPLTYYLRQKAAQFSNAFSQIIAAQVKISAINTTLTGIYILIVLPALIGRPLPFSVTIICITFVCGLIPVVGNLISNTVIVVVSLGVSLGTAIGSLVFLVVIHKLEYLINSRIIGNKTGSEAWEILIAIIIGQGAFGVPGVIMAPIIYAFIKSELRSKRLI